MDTFEVVDRKLHQVLSRHECRCKWQGDDIITHILDVAQQGEHLLLKKTEYNELVASHDRYKKALEELNKLRSNVVATQSASWPNALYPLVAILDRAGFKLNEDVTPEEMADHLLSYGGAGASPDHLKSDCRKGDLWKRQFEEAKKHGTASQRLRR